jgi:hypothetical protein
MTGPDKIAPSAKLNAIPAPKKIPSIIATIMTGAIIVLNCLCKYASAPSLMALAIFCIFSSPAFEERTLFATNNPYASANIATMGAIYAKRGSKYIISPRITRIGYFFSNLKVLCKALCALFCPFWAQYQFLGDKNKFLFFMASLCDFVYLLF